MKVTLAVRSAPPSIYLLEPETRWLSGGMDMMLRGSTTSQPHTWISPNASVSVRVAIVAAFVGYHVSQHSKENEIELERSSRPMTSDLRGPPVFISSTVDALRARAYHHCGGSQRSVRAAKMAGITTMMGLGSVGPLVVEGRNETQRANGR